MEAVKKQTKLDRVKMVLTKRRERLESSYRHYTEWDINEKDDSARRAREYLIEITQVRLDEVNAVLMLINGKYPENGEWSYANMDDLLHKREAENADFFENFKNILH
jgi:hypothetical protein